MIAGIEEHVYRLAEITLPVLIVIWRNKRAAKKARDEQHAENKKNIDDVKKQLEFCPPHLHTEETGVLKVTGIYPKRKTA